MHEGHRERLRAKLLSGGLSSLNEHEILEIILFYAIPRQNTNPIAHELIDTFGSLANVIDADLTDLMSVKGIGENSAAFIKIIGTLADYCQRLRWRDKPFLKNANDTGTYLLDMIGDRREEYFFLLSLDISGKVISFNEIEHGTVTGSNVDVRKVLECAIRCHASSVVLAHNHPTGRLIPSENDISLTNVLAHAFDAVGITVIDHIITGGGGFISLSEKGYIK